MRTPLTREEVEAILTRTNDNPDLAWSAASSEEVGRLCEGYLQFEELLHNVACCRGVTVSVGLSEIIDNKVLRHTRPPKEEGKPNLLSFAENLTEHEKSVLSEFLGIVREAVKK